MKEVLFAHSFFAGEVDDLVGVGQHGTEKGAFGLEVVVREKAFNGDGGRGHPDGHEIEKVGRRRSRSPIVADGASGTIAGRKLLENLLGKRWITMNNLFNRGVPSREGRAG